MLEGTEKQPTDAAPAAPAAHAAPAAPPVEPPKPIEPVAAREIEVKIEGDSMTIACQDLREIPGDLVRRCGGPLAASRVTHADLSFNSIQRVTGLEGFPTLRTLVLDNNALESNQPNLPSTLRVLSVNGNSIDDVDVFLGSLKPLTHLRTLSMLKNPACPSPFFGGDGEDYARHRLYVLSNLPGLDHLDATPVSQKERAEALRRGALLRTAKPAPEAYTKPVPKDPADEESTEPVPELPQQLAEPGKSGPAHFGVCSYVYYGKQSEGNRFILNEDL